MKESVWLDRGKRVDELISLSLEPEITIHEGEEEVSVRGVLQLLGEYRSPVEEVEEDDSNASLAHRADFRSVDEVSDMEGVIEEVHRQFPIDVTIPKERINSMEDVNLFVTNFDYQLPDSKCLEINADLSITGVRSEEDNSNEEENDEEFENLEGRSFSFEQVRTEKGYTDVYDNDEVNDAAVPEDFYAQKKDQFDDEREESFIPEVEEEYEEEVHQHEPRVSFRSEASDNKLSVKDEVKTEAEASDYNEFEEDQRHDLYGEEANVIENTTDAEEEDSKNSERDVEEDQEEESENALYLTKMLSDREEEGYSKLRMCIIQEGESLDVIANRYSLEVSHLMRVNRLKDEEVSEGQLLYIPVRKSSSSR